MLIVLILSFMSQIVSSAKWAVCESRLQRKSSDEKFTVCDICYVEDRPLQGAKKPMLSLIHKKMLTEFDCFECPSKIPKVVPYTLDSATFDDTIEMYFVTGDQDFAGILAIVSFTNASYEYVIKVTGEGLGSLKISAPWIFVRINTPCLKEFPAVKLLSMLKDAYKTTITSYLIDMDNSPLEYHLYSALGMQFLTLFTLLSVILLKKCDRRHIVYSLDQFVDCSRTNRRIEFGVYIARFNKLASFFGVFFLIFFSVAVTMAPMFIKYFYYVGYGVCGSTSVMFIFARIPMVFQMKCKVFTQKSYQIAFIVVTTAVGAIATLIIVLLNDDTFFSFMNHFSNICISVLPFWFTLNFVIVVALLTHITFRSYVELAMFEIGCIIMDQVFRTAFFTNYLHENKESKPFLDFYYMYGDSYFQINQGYKYENSSTVLSSFEPHTTALTNPFVFKWHWHYAGFACQIPYNRFYPIWFITIPGFALLHSYHYNAEQTERPSKLFPVLLFIVVMIGSIVEECIRMFLDFPIAIGVITFSVLSMLSLLWFWRRKEVGDFVKGVYVFVSRSHVSSGT